MSSTLSLATPAWRLASSPQLFTLSVNPELFNLSANPAIWTASSSHASGSGDRSRRATAPSVARPSERLGRPRRRLSAGSGVGEHGAGSALSVCFEVVADLAEPVVAVAARMLVEVALVIVLGVVEAAVTGLRRGRDL